MRSPSEPPTPGKSCKKRALRLRLRLQQDLLGQTNTGRTPYSHTSDAHVTTFEAPTHAHIRVKCTRAHLASVALTHQLGESSHWAA